MSRSRQKLARTGLTICAALAFAGGAKLATLLPVTDAGMAAWAQTFTPPEGDAGHVEPVSAEQLAALRTVPETARPGDSLDVIAEERRLLERQKAAQAEATASIRLAREALLAEAGRLEALKGEVEALLARAEARHDADVEQLVALYAGMKPREAATLLMQMDLEVAVWVLVEMDPRRAAPILAEMPHDRAQAVSRVMLERAKMPGDRQAVQVHLR